MKTLALVIGNDDYYKKHKLENAVNDAISVKDVFERLERVGELSLVMIFDTL
ncbi:caspase domain-containing protein [Spirosoma oryzae]|uniref:Caspase domain-containing protein n=1 Tax=Spirosoma oryzae TaxID=1469603 RepID=A0A2T0SC93_9BACT|nr:caspase domain-containing protein [Spirosoma oryzae]